MEGFRPPEELFTKNLLVELFKNRSLKTLTITVVDWLSRRDPMMLDLVVSQELLKLRTGELCAIVRKHGFTIYMVVVKLWQKLILDEVGRGIVTFVGIKPGPSEPGTKIDPCDLIDPAYSFQGADKKGV